MMGLLSLEARVEQVVTSMNDEVIVNIVRKLGWAVWGSLQRHARQLALISAAAVPAFFVYKYFRVLMREWHLEWQWERKCHMTLVCGQLWVPVRMQEMERAKQLKIRSRSPAGSRACAGRARGREGQTLSPDRSASFTLGANSSSAASFQEIFCGEQAESTDASPRAKTHVSFDGCSSLLLDAREGTDASPRAKTRASFDSCGSLLVDAREGDSEGEHSDGDAPDSAETLCGVAKRTLFQDDVWNIGILRDKRIQRKMIEAAMKTSVEDPFVTSFLDDCDKWYVMNALVNQLSGLCAVSHLGALHKGELYSDADAFVVALMVPRSRSHVKRDFLGEEFTETSTSLTKIRAVVVKEKHVVQIARRRVYMDPNVVPRFEERWHVLEMIGDKYRRFEACKILRAAIARQEREGAAVALQEGESEDDVDAQLDDRAISLPPQVWQKQESDSSHSHPMSRIFSRMSSPKLPKEAHLSEECRRQRLQEISALQFIETAIKMRLSPREAEMLFQVLDVNGDGMLSVDEVESESHTKGRQYAGRNYISMHLQRVFLPVPFCRRLS